MLRHAGMDDAFGLYLVMTDPVAGYEACAARRSGAAYAIFSSG